MDALKREKRGLRSPGMGPAEYYGDYMNATKFEQGSASSAVHQPTLLHSILVEPLLVGATVTFWLLALPFVAVSLACVKIWDAFIALNSINAATPNLFLRNRRQLQGAPAFSSPVEIWASSHI